LSVFSARAALSDSMTAAAVKPQRARQEPVLDFQPSDIRRRLYPRLR
jgi:hypothetical protein